MNITDLALLIIWSFFFFRGYFRGLVKEAASILSLIIGFKLAVAYSPQLSPHIAPMVSNPAFAGPAAFIIIFVAVMLACSVLVMALAAAMKLTLIDWANKFFGGAFGLAKGVLITALILWVWTALLAKPDFMRQSRLVPLVERVDQYLAQYIPPDWKGKLKTLTPPPLAVPKRHAPDASQKPASGHQKKETKI